MKQFIDETIKDADIKTMETELNQLKQLRALESFFIGLKIHTWLTEYEFFDNDNKPTTLYVLYLDDNDDNEWDREIYFENGNLYFNDLSVNKIITLKVGD